MGLSVFTGSFALSTAAAGGTQDVTDPGMSGINLSSKAVVIFCWNKRTVAGQAEADHGFGMGYAVSATDRGGATSQSDHNNTTMATDCQWFDNACIKTLTITGTLDGAMDFNSYITDGFRLDIDDAFPSAYLVTFLAIWGSDLIDAKSVTASASATGNTNITAVGFQPTCALCFAADMGAAVNTTTTYSQFGFGVAAGIGTPNNYTLACASSDAAPTSITMSYCRSGECISALGDDAVADRVSITTWLSNGFTMNVAEKLAATTSFRALCLKGPQFFAGDILSQINTNNTSETGIGFHPSALIFASHCKAQSTSDTTQAHDERSIGFATSPSQRNCVGLIDKDNSGSADVGISLHTDQVYSNQSTAATIAIEGLMDLVEQNSNGFTFVMDDADPAQAFVWYLAIGEQYAVERYGPPYGHRGRSQMHQLLSR